MQDRSVCIKVSLPAKLLEVTNQSPRQSEVVVSLTLGYEGKTGPLTVR